LFQLFVDLRIQFTLLCISLLELLCWQTIRRSWKRRFLLWNVNITIFRCDSASTSYRIHCKTIILQVFINPLAVAILSTLFLASSRHARTSSRIIELLLQHTRLSCLRTLHTKNKVYFKKWLIFLFCILTERLSCCLGEFFCFLRGAFGMEVPRIFVPSAFL